MFGLDTQDAVTDVTIVPSAKVTVHDPAKDGAETFIPWDNPQGIMTYKQYLSVVFYYNIILKPLVVVVGVSTNVVNCLVFRRQGLRDRMNLCLFVHSLVDMTFLTYSIAFTVSYFYRLVDAVVGEEYYLKTLYYAQGALFGLREASAGISVVIAVERCLCVVFPLRASTLMHWRTMGMLLAAIVVLMQAAFITTPLKYSVVSIASNTSAGARWQPVPDGRWQTDRTLQTYSVAEDALMQIVVPIGTFIIVSLCTTVTVLRLQAAMSWREKTSSSGSDAQVRQVALTRMLVLVSGVFIASKVPFVVMILARNLVSDFSTTGRYYNLYMTTFILVYYLPYANSAVNFFVYVSRSARFRQDLRAIMCGASTSTRQAVSHLSAATSCDTLASHPS